MDYETKFAVTAIMNRTFASTLFTHITNALRTLWNIWNMNRDIEIYMGIISRYDLLHIKNGASYRQIGRIRFLISRIRFHSRTRHTKQKSPTRRSNPFYKPDYD
jgi:hypothetical protein